LVIKALITGGNGYLGRLLISQLVREGHDCVSLDIRSPDTHPPGIQAIRADLADSTVLTCFSRRTSFDVIFHLASQIDFAAVSQRDLYDNNLRCTNNVAQLAKNLSVPKVVFTSSNSVYIGNHSTRPIREVDNPDPRDHYGRSKIDSEHLLYDHQAHFDTVVLRCPNVIDASRVGLLSILFEFVREGRKCWVIGRGAVRHQCVYAGDLMDACMRSVAYQGSNLFHIGSDNVPTFASMYQYLIDQAGTTATVAQVPRTLAIPLIRTGRALHLLPFGDYQLRMLTRDFLFDTSKIKRELSWVPTLSNGQMLYKAYEHYASHREEILHDSNRSANRRAVAMGLLGLLKRLS
jgi:nucleoside-diphosphate-sugar epimerase